MSDKLEACPFCNGEAAIYESQSLRQYRVFCKGCRTQTSFHDSKECIIAAWNRRATPTAETGWQDMESAPRDGSWVLVYCPMLVGFRIDIAYYGEDERYDIPGQWMDNDGDSFGRPSILKPTHWRPLPPPPQEVE